MSRVIAELELQVIDLKGRVVSEVKQPSRSFVSQFTEILYNLMSHNAPTVADISNTGRALHTTRQQDALLMASCGGDSTLYLRGDAPNVNINGEADYLGDQIGIQVGTGAVAVTANDYVMGTRVAHGQAATQLLYGGSEAEQPVVANPNASILLRRYFTNKSGGSITINEVGIYVPAFTAATVAYMFLICRDVLGAGVAVADTALLRVQYTVQVTV